MIKHADDTGDIDRLAKFPQEESYRAIEELLQYDPDTSYPKIIKKKTIRSILGKKLGKIKLNESIKKASMLPPPSEKPLNSQQI